jgi:hypothetical protein
MDYVLKEDFKQFERAFERGQIFDTWNYNLFLIPNFYSIFSILIFRLWESVKKTDFHEACENLQPS